MKEIKSTKIHRRAKQLEVIVTRVITETPDTPDTSTLVLFAGNDDLSYEPGHFVTIEELKN